MAGLTGAVVIDVYYPLKDDKLNSNYDQIHLSVQGCGKVAEIVSGRIAIP